MKYKLKIIPHQEGYVGYALLNDEVVHTTQVLNNPSLVANYLAIFTSENGESSVINNATNEQFVPASPSPSDVAPPATPRKCCGRG